MPSVAVDDAPTEAPDAIVARHYALHPSLGGATLVVEWADSFIAPFNAPIAPTEAPVAPTEPPVESEDDADVDDSVVVAKIFNGDETELKITSAPVTSAPEIEEEVHISHWAAFLNHLTQW
eukprot:CAMPEP_0178920308 /NCGR_PEP_ID=MMETSP0786-20121207/14934_1 /TAXON_ID=186022 /ORGANISM="Thalassionema frauenfeldii, Strain CCMP 1798" /LENGTH=120 /DNA_ID=CAMNT_0020594363 /DNA_START=225 /DNA_END=584 /DNA_ORIENTATION=+